MARSKYKVAKKEDRTYNGIVFDSKTEMQYYRDVLLPLYNSGKVTYYELQKTYELQPKFKYDGKNVQPIKYVADFFIVYKDGHEELIDTKCGKIDSVALLKRKMFWYHYPDIDYKWLVNVKKFGGWITYEQWKEFKKEEKKKK